MQKVKAKSVSVEGGTKKQLQAKSLHFSRCPAAECQDMAQSQDLVLAIFELA